MAIPKGTTKEEEVTVTPPRVSTGGGMPPTASELQPSERIGLVSPQTSPRLTPDEIWKKWMDIWEDTRDMVQPGPDVSEWWEYSDAYPETAEKNVEARRKSDLLLVSPFGPEAETGLRSIDQFGFMSGEEAAAKEIQKGETPETFWSALGGWAEKKREEAADFGVVALDALKRKPVASTWTGAKVLGKTYLAPLLYDAEALRTAVLFGIEMAEGKGYPKGQAARDAEIAALSQGNYEQQLRESLESAGLDPNLYQAELKRAAEAQQRWNDEMADVRMAGLPEETRNRLVLGHVYKNKKLFEGESTGESPIPWSQDARDAWEAAKGGRWSHVVFKEKSEEYWDLIEAGVDPKTAGDATTVWWVELPVLMVGSPLNWTGLDTAIYGPVIKGGKKIAGGILKGAGKVASKVPVLKNVIGWMGELTARTQANYALRYTDDVLRATQNYARQTGRELTADVTEQLLKNPPEDFLRGMTSYQRRALRGLDGYVDDTVSSIKRVVTDENIGKAMKVVREEVARETTEAIPETVIRQRAMRKVWDEALEKANNLNYRTAMKGALEESIEKYPGINKIAQKIRPLDQAVMQPLRSSAVNRWLGGRPAWNVFNAVDNTIKLLLDGINPANSVRHMAARYVEYAPEYTRAVEALDELGKIKFWNASTDSHLRFRDNLHALAPNQALSTFGESAAPERMGGIGRKLPIVGEPIGAALDWNFSLSGRIEGAANAKSYYHNFFERLDDGWAALRNRPMEAVIEGVPVSLSDEVADVVRARLNQIRNPTAAKVRAVLREFVEETPMAIVKPNLGDELIEGMGNVPQQVRINLQTRLNSLVELGTDGPQVVSRNTITRIFQDAGEELDAYYDEMIEAGRRAFVDSLVDVPMTSEGILSAIVPSGLADASMEELWKGVDELPLVEEAFKAQDDVLLKEHWNEAKALIKARGRSPEYAKLMDDFFGTTRPQRWAEFHQNQRKTVIAIADELDARLVLAGSDQRVPREALNRYLDATESLNNLAVERAKHWEAVFQQKGALSKREFDELFRLTRKQIDDTWRQAKPDLDDQVHRALEEFTTWFKKTALHEVPTSQEVMTTGKAAADMIAGRMADIKATASRVVDPASAELRALQKEVLSRRVAPYTTVGMSELDRQVLEAALTDMGDSVGRLISDSQTMAIERTRWLLFDYETTQNWQMLLEKLVPFAKFPLRNIPLWIDLMGNHPHFMASVIRIRQAQAIANADLPERLRYTIPIPNVLTDPFMEALGLNNTQLRINPWSFFSFFQQVPGATAYSQRQIAGAVETAEDGDVRDRIGAFAIVAKELGFGPWPWLEWIMGQYGLLGDDWYPRDAYGTWTPVVNWMVREMTGYEKGYDVDKFIREHSSQVWNAVFGDTPLRWDQLTPDMMEEWALGREIEAVNDAMPDPAVAALVEMDPLEAEQLLRTVDPATIEMLRKNIQPIFEMSQADQIRLISALTPVEQAVFLDEMEMVATRRMVRKQLFTTVMGNMTGLYLDPVNDAEIEAHRMRVERRIEQQSRVPGPERRDFMKQWYVEHPKYIFNSTWRFSQHPWAETAAGREAELWDTLVDDFKGRYYEYNRAWKVETEQVVNETYREHPGDVLRLKAVRAERYAAKDAYVEALNQELEDELTLRIEAYIDTYPNDKEGIRLLKEGWETTVYVPVTLNDEEQAELRAFRAAHPDNPELQRQAFQKLYAQALKRQPTEQKRRVPGLEDGIRMDLRWSPVDDPDYSEEEIEEFLIGDLLRELHDAAPVKDEYTSSKEFWVAYNTYLEELPEAALKTKQAQYQVEQMMRTQRMTRAEAEKIVGSWYTEEDLRERWRRNDTVMEAVEYAYQWHVISEADDEWYDVILPMKEEDLDKYSFMKAELEMRTPAMSATDLIPYIMKDYPGKWTVAQLQKELRGIEMPSYFDRMTMRSTGEKAVTSHIWYFYNQLDADTKRAVREKFGPIFQDQFLVGKTEGISVELLGGWMDSLASSLGDERRWRELPGVDEAMMKSSIKEMQEFGLPKLKPRDMEEWEKAQKINHAYWQAVVAGNPTAEALKNDPLYKKWFGNSSPKSYFWDFYYNNIPPGPFSKDLKNNVLVEMILDKEPRYTAATNSDYDRAIGIMEEWLDTNSDRMVQLGLDPFEWDRVRELSDAYYGIPEEEKKLRKAFLEANPLLKKYFEAGKAKSEATEDKASGNTRTGRGGGGGGGGGSQRVDSRDLWSSLRTRVGQSLASVLRVLLYYWENQELPEQSEAYLRKLHAELGAGLSFEDWLTALQAGWSSLGTRGSTGNLKVGTVRQPPRPRYERTARGIRR